MNEFETVAWIHGRLRPIQVDVIVQYTIDEDGRPDILDIVDATGDDMRDLLVENEENIIFHKLEAEINGTLNDAADALQEIDNMATKDWDDVPIPANARIETVIGLAKLREPFPEHQISKLPKPTKKQTEEVRANYKAGIRCQICGTWHHPDVIHLDYVGHAALTDRLLDADPAWYWEPLSIADGLPVRDQAGGMWIKLTVCGVTRLGYGHAGDKTGGDAIKEIIGDALRNAAMRFGAALDLWHKGDLHLEEEPVKDSFKTVAKSDWESLDPETQEWMTNEAMAVTVMLADGDVEGAHNHIQALGMDDTYRTAFDTRLDSKQRAILKGYSQIIHAQTLGALTVNFEAVPQYAKPLLKPFASKRKAELTQPEQEAA